MKYLGMPIKEKRLNNSDWNGSVGKTEAKLSPWKGKNTSIGGRTILINSSLTSVSLFMMSFYRIPMGIVKRKDIFRSRFLWSSDPDKKKYHLVAWNQVCLPKDQGGLGILNLDIMKIGRAHV